MCPRIFHIYGPLWVNGYGLMIALGFMLFTYLTYRHPRRKRLISDENYLNVLFIGFLSAIVGGRFLFVLFNLFSFDSVAEIFYPWVGGFSLFGSIIFVLVAVSIYLKKIDTAIFPFFDVIALYVPLLQSVARVGCFLAGCCYGAPTKQWWGVTFSSLHSLAPLHVPLHPTQLYSSLASLSIFFILYFVSKRIYRIPGTLVLLYLILESCSRFTVDLWRGDGDIAMRGIVSVLFLISLVVLINLVYGKKNKDIKNKKEAR